MNKLILFTAIIPLLVVPLVNALAITPIKLTTSQEQCIRMILSSTLNASAAELGPNTNIDITMRGIEACIQ